MKSEIRIKDKREFENIIKCGKIIKNAHFVIYYKERKVSFSRFGITLSKKFGNAVKRNKYRRILREIIRNNEKKFENTYDYIIIMKKSGDSLDYLAIEHALLNLISKVEAK